MNGNLKEAFALPRRKTNQLILFWMKHDMHDIFLFIDYVNGGELFTHLVQRVRFKEQEVALYSGEIVLALEHLHKVTPGFNTIKASCLFRSYLLLPTCSVFHLRLCHFLVAAWDCLSGPET